MISKALLDSPAARVTLALSALHGTTGVTLVFLPRWLEIERGLDGAAIGAVLSLSQLARIVVGPAIAYWADGAADRRMPLRAVALGSFIAFVAFFTLADEFWSLMAIGFIALSLMQAFVPLSEALALRATAEGKISYGVARGIGSACFIVANVAGGILISRFGLGAVVAWVLCGLAAMFVSAIVLKPDPAPVTHGPRRSGFTALLRTRRFLILIIASGLIQSAHAFYYGFSTIVWRGQGISSEMIGALWAVGVLLEVVFLWCLVWIERRFSPEMLLIIGAAGSVLRWLCMGFAPVGFVLWPLQVLHTLSFAATHVGAMRLIYREAPQSAAAMAQTLYSAISSGLFMGAATLMSGWLYDAGGARGYWAMAAMAAVGGAVALMLLTQRPRSEIHS